jgi:hypothetical protein
MWRDTSKDRTFKTGSSDDVAALKSTFGTQVSTDDINTLQAMHRACGRRDQTLWGEIAETLNRLQGDDPERKVTLEIWPEY